MGIFRLTECGVRNRYLLGSVVLVLCIFLPLILQAFLPTFSRWFIARAAEGETLLPISNWHPGSSSFDGQSGMGSH